MIESKHVTVEEFRKMKTVSMGLAKVKIDDEGNIWTSLCRECNKLISMDEQYYGHDCEC